jgi:hypothetical protein
MKDSERFYSLAGAAFASGQLALQRGDSAAIDKAIKLHSKYRHKYHQAVAREKRSNAALLPEGEKP